MKIIIAIIGFFTAVNLPAQTTVSVNILHTIPGTKLIVNVPFDNWLYDENAVQATPRSDGMFTVAAPVQHPQFIVLTYGGIKLKLYAGPATKMKLAFDANDYAKTLQFTGDLSAENKVCVTTGLSFFNLYPVTYNDTLTSPADMFEAMQKAQAEALQVLRAAGANTTAAFKQIAGAEINYFAAGKLVDLSFKNDAWTTRPTGEPRFTLSQWKQAIAKAYDSNPISNDSAVNSYNYLTMLNNLPFFIQRRYDSKEDLMPIAEKIMGMPFAEIPKQLRAKGKSYFDYKALMYSLHGLALQKALAAFIDKEIQQGELECIDEVYNDFAARFGSGEYAAHVMQAAKPYLAAKGVAIDEASFITDTSLTFSKAIATFKGKVVYIDMWGTWCPACREEMKYTHAVKDHYGDKPVAFVYMAFEHNTNPEKNWKETVHFFNLSGTHILANAYMQQYINEVYKNGQLVFPSYILIDKNGNIANANAAEPSTPAELFKQIDALL